MKKASRYFTHRIVPHAIATDALFMGNTTLDKMRTIQRQTLMPIVDIDDLHRMSPIDTIDHRGEDQG